MALSHLIIYNNLMYFVDVDEKSSNEFKNSTVETPPTVAELDVKLLADNLNKFRISKY